MTSGCAPRPPAISNVRSFHRLVVEIGCPFGATTVIIGAYSASGGRAGMRLSREAWVSGRGKLFVANLVASNRWNDSSKLHSSQSPGASGAAPISPTEKYVYASYIREPVVKDGTGGTVYYHRNSQYSVGNA